MPRWPSVSTVAPEAVGWQAFFHLPSILGLWTASCWRWGSVPIVVGTSTCNMEFLKWRRVWQLLLSLSAMRDSIKVFGGEPRYSWQLLFDHSSYTGEWNSHRDPSSGSHWSQSSPLKSSSLRWCISLTPKCEIPGDCGFRDDSAAPTRQMSLDGEGYCTACRKSLQRNKVDFSPVEALMKRSNFFKGLTLYKRVKKFKSRVLQKAVRDGENHHRCVCVCWWFGDQ